MTPVEKRKRIVRLIDEANQSGARRRKASEIVGISVRTIERWREKGKIEADRRKTRIYEPLNKLSKAEREKVLEVVNSKGFSDLPPSQIVPVLAERGEYLASESTIYRILREANQLGHRQESRVAKKRSKPKELAATKPNQLYSWDITYLPQAVRGMFFYLYIFMDIYSRKIVGWQVYEEQSSEWASEILCDIAYLEGIRPKQVTLHSDNGGPMKGATMLSMLQTLGIEPSFSRPAVSNDNPYSESLFRTIKYRPQYPKKPFEDINDAREWVGGIVNWYNFEHRHSGIRFVTPAQRHAGLDGAILSKRRAVYERARNQNPERWSQQTRNWTPITEVHLNPGKKATNTDPSNLKMAA